MTSAHNDATQPDFTGNDMAWSYFKRHVREIAGIDLSAYRESQMRRRLGQMMMRRNLPSWVEYVRALRDDPATLAEFRDFFTINVSEFFRQPERYDALRRRYLPRLVQERRRLVIWSAGCSIGAEPYSLAMLLAEQCESRHRLLATDIDDTVLARARGGRGYSDADVRHVPAEFRERYLVRNADTYDVTDEIISMVEFRRHDLLHDAYPENCDLIVCRNVVIYFTEEAKRAMYTRFYEALRPGGLLFVGGTEIVTDARDLGFEHEETSFYRKEAIDDRGRIIDGVNALT